MKRYFLVYYVAIDIKTGGLVNGNMIMICDNCFLNRKKTTSLLNDENRFKDVVIKGWNEMNESDYFYWIAE